MSKMTFKFTHSFDATVIVDVEAMREQIQKLAKGADHPDFHKLPAKNRAFIGLILEANKKSEEHGIAEFLRYNLRTGLNETIADELACKDNLLTIRPPPVKVVCHGIEI